MSHTSVRAEGLRKQYRIPSANAPHWFDYLRSPRAARSGSRTTVVDALCGVSFEVHEGEVFGIIGRNGAGKSTLLKILSRITTPSGGRATMRGRVASLLEVGTGFHPELTGRENVFLNGTLLGMPRREVERVLDEIVAFAGVETYIDTPIKRYSTGMQLRLAFAVAAHLAADTIIVDEVLAVGDAEFQEKCARTMRSSTERGRTTLFVSHNMAAVESLCTRAILLERGAVAAAGPVHEVVQQYLKGSSASHTDTEYVSSERDVTRAVQIHRIAARSPSGGTPVQGGDLDIVVELWVRQRIRRLQCLIWLATVEGSPVCALSNGDYRQEWDLRPGSYRVTIRVPAVRLLPRSYVATVQAVTDWGAERYDEVREAVRFQVQSRDVLGTGVALLENRGVIWMPATYHLESVPSEEESVAIRG
jgi:lipopolysaccharide transport system ATP-binding protein